MHAWLRRRETPEAIAVTFTGWKPEGFAFCFPLAVEATILAIACVALHLWWNISNQSLLGDVYGWNPAYFTGSSG